MCCYAESDGFLIALLGFDVIRTIGKTLIALFLVLVVGTKCIASCIGQTAKTTSHQCCRKGKQPPPVPKPASDEACQGQSFEVPKLSSPDELPVVLAGASWLAPDEFILAPARQVAIDSPPNPSISRSVVLLI